MAIIRLVAFWRLASYSECEFSFRLPAFRLANFMLRSSRPSCSADQKVADIAKLY